jgi:hypothetical protein
MKEPGACGSHLYMGDWDWEDHVSRSAWAKIFVRPPSQGQLPSVGHACHPIYGRKHKISWSRQIWTKSENLSPKITRAKWAGGKAQAVECLLRKHDPLSSHTHTQNIIIKDMSVKWDCF